MSVAETALAETALAETAGGALLRRAELRTLCGWGRTAPSRARVVRPEDAEQLGSLLAVADPARGGVIARGAGRSYGDQAQNADGVVLDMTALAWIGEPDEERCTVRVGAGATLGQLLQRLAPRGLMLPVTPGTKHVTVGGAIAADVHGKNHHRDGSFAHHLEEFAICLPGGELRRVSRDSDSELFAATIGGMGLTGVVLEATLRLESRASYELWADIERVGDLESALSLLAEDDPAHRYAIAWVDLLTGWPARRGMARWGRSVVARSGYAPAARGACSDARSNGAVPHRAGGSDAGPARAGSPFRAHARLRVPRGFPGGALNPATARAFNTLRWSASPRRARGRPVDPESHFFPLDALEHWSRLYGRQGLVQYQFAVPRGQEHALVDVVAHLVAARLPMYLAVLKRFGAGSGGLLSFPAPGFTMAIDLPAGAPGLRAALRHADELVAGAGGRVYLAKDALLHPDALAAMYPQLERFRAVRASVDPEGVLTSDMGRRLGLSEPAARHSSQRTASGRRRVLVLGGTSEIARAIVAELADRAPCEALLVGRSQTALEHAAESLRGLGNLSVLTLAGLEAADRASHRALLERALGLLGGADLVVLAVGMLGERGGMPSDMAGALDVLEVNVVGSGSLLMESARALSERGGGTLVVLSSVAAERPRRANAVYGASKAALDGLSQALADDLRAQGVRIVVVRPGFVRTRMTRGLAAPPFATSAEAVAKATVRGLERGAQTVWAPGLLRWLGIALRIMPRALFRRLSL
jgi:decaprenylphospho-beta-D-ribofuranose 2-oxidase